MFRAYDPNSIEWVHLVTNALRDGDLSECARMIEDATLRFEQEVDVVLADLDRQVKVGDVAAVVKQIAGPFAFPLVRQWVSVKFLHVQSSALDELSEAVRMSGEFPLRSPLNVVACVDVLFHLTVVPHRCEVHAASTLHSCLGQDLEIDLAGEGTETEAYHVPRFVSSKRERAFWRLIDEVATDWIESDVAFRNAERAALMTDLLRAPTEARFLAFAINDHAQRRVWQRAWSEIVSERPIP